MKPLQVVRTTPAGAAAAAARRRPDRPRGGAPAPRRRCGAGRAQGVCGTAKPSSVPHGRRRDRPGARRRDVRRVAPTTPAATPDAIPVSDEFAAYVWSASVAEVAARHGLSPAQVLKFDQNTPPLPGVPQVPLAESFATLNEYPSGAYRELREAAAGYVSRQTSVDVDWEQIVVGAGADDLILLCARTYLGPGRSSSIVTPAYSMYRIATLLERRGADVRGRRRVPALALQPRQPDRGRSTPAEDLVELAGRYPERRGRGRRGLRRVRRRVGRPVAARVPEPDRAADDVEGVRLRIPPRRLRGRGTGDRGGARGAPCPGADRVRRGPHRRGGAARAPLRPQPRDERARARPRPPSPTPATTSPRARATSSGCGRTTISPPRWRRRASSCVGSRRGSG